MLKIGIIGTRGIPNHYGGFEQLAQYLSAGLVGKGHSVSVYNADDHPYKKSEWYGVSIIHCYNGEHFAGTAGQFIYDLNCTLDARKKKFDVLLILGYTSSSVWGWLYPRNTICINHMDGLEWKRQKYGFFSRLFLKYAEKLAVRFSRFFIADALAIRSYLAGKYHIESEYIAYGADIIAEEKDPTGSDASFFLLIARMEKENNIELILDGVHASNTGYPFIVVGNIDNRFGKYLTKKYNGDPRIQFAGSIYDADKTAFLKKNCRLYFHGHSVGGTNPSLLEAMAAGALVCAHDNVYNREVLENAGFYFSSVRDVKELLEAEIDDRVRQKMTGNNLAKIRERYHWSSIIDSYDRFIRSCYQQQKT